MKFQRGQTWGRLDGIVGIGVMPRAAATQRRIDVLNRLWLVGNCFMLFLANDFVVHVEPTRLDCALCYYEVQNE